ncbi:hypothetical protein Bca101_017879 [Brassica carinata]
MASFPNLNSAAGLKKLDEHLLTRYYITSYKASKDDITVFAALSNPPPPQYMNVSRWYNHIETLLSVAGISSEGSGVTIDGLVSITKEAYANSKDGVWVVVDDDNVQDVELVGEEAEEEQKSAEVRAASLIESTKKKIIWESVVIVVMPNDDIADMEKLEERVRSIQMKGLIWGPFGYGVKFLRIIASAPIIDQRCDLDDILEDDRITSFGSFRGYTNVLFEYLILIKPKDDEADMKKLEETVRSIKVEGLFWGASKLVPIGYGIKLLGIECTVVGYLTAHLGTIVKEKITDNRTDDDGLLGDEGAGSWKKNSAGKSGLVL